MVLIRYLSAKIPYQHAIPWLSPGLQVACRWLVTGGSAGPPRGICLEGRDKANPHILATSSHASSGRVGGPPMSGLPPGLALSWMAGRRPRLLVSISSLSLSPKCQSKLPVHLLAKAPEDWRIPRRSCAL